MATRSSGHGLAGAGAAAGASAVGAGAAGAAGAGASVLPQPTRETAPMRLSERNRCFMYVLEQVDEGGRIGLLPVVNIVGLGSPISGCTMLVFPRMRGGRGNAYASEQPNLLTVAAELVVVDSE